MNTLIFCMEILRAGSTITLGWAEATCGSHPGILKRILALLKVLLFLIQHWNYEEIPN